MEIEEERVFQERQSLRFSEEGGVREEGVTGVKTFKIDLDLKPKHRWSEVARVYKQELKGVEEIVERFIAENLGRIGQIGAGIGDSLFSFITRCGVVYYNEELQALSELTGLPLGKVAILQLVYEASAHCTSIVTTGENGLPIHARTMDWEMDFLRPLTVNYEFYRGGKLVFKGPSWVGYVGVLTGIKPLGFSVSVNFRISDGTFWENFKKAVARSWPIGFLVREVLDTCQNYESAVECLKNSSLIAPTYFTVAGTQKNQGTIITRERESHVNPIILADRPFLIQTNMDHFSDDPMDDIMFSVHRRRAAARWLEKLGPTLNQEKLWKILSQPPIWNDITTYGCIMSPIEGILETRLPNADTGFLPSDFPAPVKGEPHYKCKNCGKDFIESLNPSGFCGHKGDWHSAYSDCSKIKCGWGLGKNIGLAHYSCCFSTLKDSPCKKSGPHVAP